MYGKKMAREAAFFVCALACGGARQLSMCDLIIQQHRGMISAIKQCDDGFPTGIALIL